MTLGNTPARALLGDHNFKISGKRGMPIDLDEIGIVLPTMHPAAVLRNPTEANRWVDDIKYAGRILNGGTAAVKKVEKVTAWVMLTDPNEAVRYDWVRELDERGKVITTGYDEERAWDESIVDGSQLADWPIRRVVTGIPAAVRAVDMLLRQPVLAADIETGYSLSPRLGKVLALSVSWTSTDAVVFSEGLLRSKAFRGHLLRLLTSSGPLWVGHNFKYDSSYLRHQILGAQWPEDGALVNYHDTMLEHYCLNETKGTHDLEQVSRDFLGAVDYKHVVKKYTIKANKEKGIVADQGYENVPREVLYPYAAVDTCHTFALHQHLCPKVHESKGLTNLYDNLLMPASRFLQRVQDYGLHVNQEYVKAIEDDLTARMHKAEDDLAVTVEPIWDTDEYMASKWATKKRPGGYNARNWRHTSFMLEKLIGWVPMNTNERTLRDLDQTGKDQSATFGYKAKNYARGHPNRKQKLNYPYIQALIDVRLAKQAYGTLIEGIRKNTEPDGRLHTTFNLQATETGRLSSTGPNLQNLPVPEKDDPLPARDIVGAPAGRVIIEADFSQVELRLLAHFSKDDTLIEIYREGRDLHTELSIAIWGDREYDEDGKQIGGYTNYQRVRAKAVNFGIAYGRGAGSIAAEHDIPQADAEEMRQAWFKRFPQAAEWLDKLHRMVLTGQTVISPFGRRRRFGVVSREKHHEQRNQAANFPMQSTASDLTLYSAMRIQEKWDKMGVDAHVICLVHDSIVAECPVDESEQRAEELRTMMEDTPRRVLDSKIAFPVDIHVGRAWGTLKLEEMDKTDKGSKVGASGSVFKKSGVASGKL